jgi:hypothetical protein
MCSSLRFRLLSLSTIRPVSRANYHVKTDIEDFHWYAGFPHQNAEFARLTNDYAARAQWTWSPHGDAVKTGREPLICSEFGVWGLPHPRDIREKDGHEPWWFESGHDWNNGAGYPHGIETRFRDAQFSPIFDDLDGFVNAAQEFQYRALKYQIETLRWARPISGYIITEINDVQWESNGLMDVQDNPRRFADCLANLQCDWLIIARSARTTIGVGESLDVSVALAGAAEIPRGASLAWKFGGQSGAMPIGANPASLTLKGPRVDSIGVQNLELEASDDEGRLLSHNVLEFCIAPPLAGETPSLFAFDSKAADILARLTCEVAMLCNLFGVRLNAHSWRGAFDLIFRFRQKSAAGRPSRTAQLHLDRLAQVLQDAESIGDLPCLRRALSTSLSVQAAAITADNLQFGTLPQLLGCPRRRSASKNIDHFPPLQVDDNNPVTATFAPSPIVNARDSNSGLRTERGHTPLQMTDNRVIASRHPKAFHQPLARTSACAMAKQLNEITDPLCPLGLRSRNFRHWVNKCPAPTLSIAASPTDYSKFDSHGRPLRRQVLQMSGL